MNIESATCERKTGGHFSLGRLSLGMGCASVLLWIAAFGFLAWVWGNRATAGQSFLALAGCGLFLVFGLNLVGVVLGAVAIVQREQDRNRAIVGTVINGVFCLLIIAIIGLGIYSRQTKLTSGTAQAMHAPSQERAVLSK